MLALLTNCNRLCVGAALIVALTGCARKRDWNPILPPPPVGSDARAFQQRQMDAAMADRLTVYRHEWAGGGDQLGDYGSRHAEEIAVLVGRTEHSILIEQDADIQLNESRRQFLVRYLIERRVDDAADRVVIGRPAAIGTSGDEAIEIFQSKPLPGTSGGGGTPLGGENRRTPGGGF